MFVNVWTFVRLPRINTTVNLNTSSDDDVGAKLLSPVVTINLFSSSGDQLSYTSNEPLMIEIPMVVSCGK